MSDNNDINEPWVALTQGQWEKLKDRLLENINRTEEAEKELKNYENKCKEEDSEHDALCKEKLDDMIEPKVPDKEGEEEKDWIDDMVANAARSFSAALESDASTSEKELACSNPLFNAAYEGKFELLKMLLENKKELDGIGIKLDDKRDCDVINGELQEMRGPLLLEAVNGLVCNIKDNGISSDLFLYLFEADNKAREEDGELRDSEGEGNWSGYLRRIDLINYLIKYNPYINDDLYYALEHEYYDSFKIMVNLLKKNNQFDFSISCKPDRNPLFSTTNPEFLRDLVILGYDVNSVNANGDTVFMLNKDVCNYFLTYSKMNYYIKNKQRHTLLYKAIEWEDKEFVNIMINRRISMNDVDINGQSPLDIAIFSGSYEIVKLLLDNGAYLYNKGSIGIKHGRYGTLKEHNHNCYKIMRALNKLEEELNE